MKARWHNVWMMFTLLGLLFFCVRSTEASPEVIVDQYDYQADCVTIAYPHFDGMLDEAAQDKMNNAIENVVEQFIEAAQRRIDNAKQDNTHYFRPVVQLNYKVWYNDDGVLSITLNSYEFFGGAHGMSTLTGYTFNLQSGDAIPYQDLFEWNSNSREFAYHKIMEQVTERKIFLFPEEDQNKVAKKLRDPAYSPNYYLTDKDKPVIIFQQYEIAPYAAGILQFTM